MGGGQGISLSFFLKKIKTQKLQHLQYIPCVMEAEGSTLETDRASFLDATQASQPQLPCGLGCPPHPSPQWTGVAARRGCARGSPC